MDSFFLALQFLTVIPLKIKGVCPEKLAFSMAYFPVVGMVLGLLMAAVYAAACALGFGPFLASVLLVAALAAITGGMHLDGLADTADGFMSGRSKDEILLIMRDPHIGAMGVISLMCALLLKTALVMSLNTAITVAALCVAASVSRWSAVMALYFFDYARQDGKAKVYKEGMNKKIARASLIAVLVIAVIWGGWRGLIALALVAGCTYLACRIATRKIGGITGDTIGATIEITELVALSVFCVK